MNAPSAKLSVLVEADCACVRIAGRANFTSSIDFKTLLNELFQRGCREIVLELSECLLMDSTFLGVLAGFALKLNGANPGASPDAIILFNPSPRIVELLDTIGVLGLFQISRGELLAACQGQVTTPPVSQPTQEELTRTCLEAHRILMDINPENIARFKDVAQFLAEDLKKQKADS